MKIIFAGTSDFAATILGGLLTNKQKVVAVYTTPDRPAGRGLRMQASPVKLLAEQYQLPIMQPPSLKSPDEQHRMNNWQADVMIVAAYGLLVPRSILNIPKFGCLNLHASLLPRWRGASPIQHAILAGDTITGITLMQMDTGLDTGAILKKSTCDINSSDTAGTLHDKLAQLASTLLLESLPEIATNKLPAQPQPTIGVTYAHKLTKADGAINWEKSALEINQQIRAFNPWPIAFTSYAGNIIRIFAAEIIESAGQNALPGTIVDVSSAGIDIATGKFHLRIKQLQIPGAKILAVRDFVNAKGKDYLPGTVLGN